jgi:hypothetical protein
MNIPNITYKGNLAKDISADNDYYQGISYFKTIEDFIDESSYSRFIKSVENMVRTSNDYKTFINYIKHTLGLDFCQVFSKISDVDADIEFHHGPIFNLYDICEVELTKFIKTGQRINTFRIADSVIDLHFSMKVNGVLLCRTAHEMFHEQEIFINVNQCIGDVNTYIKENARYFTPEVRYKIWNYVNMCESNDSFDKGALDLAVVKTYIKPIQ